LPRSGAPAPERRRARYALYYGLYWITPGATFPFFYPLLASRGLDPAELGAIAAVFSIAALVAQPVAGWLCDRTARARHILSGLSLASAALLPLFALAHGMRQETAVAAVYALFNAPLAPLADALTIAYLREAGGAYGRLRSWGSLTFAVAGVVAGWALRTHQINRTGLYLVGAACALPAALTPLTFPVEVHGLRRGRTTAGELLRARRFLLFLLLSTMALLAFNANGTYLSVYLGRLGGGPLDQGLAWAIPALLEVPLFFNLDALRRRFGLRRTLTASLACEVAALSLIGGASSPLLALTGMALQGPAFAIFYGAAVPAVDGLVPEGMRASGQSLFWTFAFGVGSIVANAGAGLLSVPLGLGGMYRVLAAFALVSAMAFALGTKGVLGRGTAPAG
jgi:PPP family 3-phenylpropionic acid transporter